jgi:sterol O-acyltransferase
MVDPKETQKLGPKLSENTLNQATKGFKRFNILENNSCQPNTSKRHSIVLDDEYDSSQLNLAAETKESKSVDVIKSYKADNKSVYRHVKSSKVRYQKNGEMRSNFVDLSFQARETIFDSEIHFGAKFYGFYVAIWICIGFFGLNVLCDYHLNHGSLFQSKIVHLMIKDIWKIALTDLIMYLSMYFSVMIQLLIKYNIISWKHTGFALQSIYEVLLLCYPFNFADKMKYPWIGQIFLMLHSCVMLMKVHSYAFFNGYLWEIKNELSFSTIFIKKRKLLEDDIKVALDNSIKFCQSEIDSQNFPNNISFKNFFTYSMFPVLVYQSEYPRNQRIRWGYLFSKILGIFGVIFLMIAIAQYKLYPIVLHCLELQKSTSLGFRLKIYPFILIETIPPFLSIYLLTFYLIWELILNAIAELSRFADREFYRYWWNSIDWNEYARDWNVPVHKFLLRHVYHSSISAFKVNKHFATFFTFFLSSIIHEFAMYVIFKKIRFYLLLLQMSQLSLVQLSRTKWMKDKLILGNCIFWFGIVFGPSLMCTMYLIF